MNTHKASLYNSLVLIFIGGWGYFETDATTALIPVVIGVILLLLNKGLKSQNKIASHLVVLFTFLILLGLFKPLSSAISEPDCLAIFRVSVMLLFTFCAFYYQVKAFLDARKK